MIEDGLFERFGIKEIYGLHNYPGMPVGSFGIRPGPILAAGDRFFLNVSGRGAHAARPNDSVDVIVASTAIVQALQTIVSRNVDPLASAVLSITTFHAGEASNVLPQRAKITGTSRSFDPSVRDLLERRIREISCGVAESYGAQADLEFVRNYPATRNHPLETRKAISAACGVASEAEVDVNVTPLMGGEDFSFMLEACPGAYIFMGNGNSQGLHHPAYDFSDEAIVYGASYWIRLVENVCLPFS
jgi:hippurate hydrolase